MACVLGKFGCWMSVKMPITYFVKMLFFFRKKLFFYDWFLILCAKIAGIALHSFYNVLFVSFFKVFPLVSLKNFLRSQPWVPNKLKHLRKR